MNPTSDSDENLFDWCV